MNYQESIKRILVGLVILVVISGVVALVVFFVRKNKPQPNATNTKVESPIKKTEVSSDKLPDKFPANLPIEAGANISQNYNANANDGRFQATRAFETKETLAKNLTIYTEYLKTNGWTIGSSVDQPAYKMVSGSKGKQQLQISMSENSGTKVKTVSMSLTILP